MKGKHVPKESQSIAITPRGRTRRKAHEDVSLMSRSVPTTFYSTKAPPKAPLLSSRRAPNDSPPSYMLPPSPDFSGELMEKFVGGRSLTYSSASNFPSSVPASFLSKMQTLNTNRSETNKTQYISRKPVANMADGDDNNSPSSSLHSGRAAEENEPPIVGSFTCFQLMDLETKEKTRTNNNFENSILFSLNGDPDPNTEQPEDDDQDDDGLQFDFD